MRQCSQCGAGLRETSRFCPGCGCPVDFARLVKESAAAHPEVGRPHALAAVSVILSVLFFIPLVFIPSAILGAVALSRIAQSGGALGGRNLAQAALLISCCVAIFQGMALFAATQSGLVTLDVPRQYLRPRGVKPADVEETMRVIANALERYRGAMGVYPRPNQYSSDLPADIQEFLPRVYLDPYRVEGSRAFRYHAVSDQYWILTSEGPDLRQDIDVERYAGSPEAYPGSGLIYDPTNGVDSEGDLWLTGPFTDFHWFENP